MLKALIANTVEVDEVEIALKDVISQLDIQKNLKRNSVGIIHCNNDFIDSGVVEAICDRLPFPVLGLNTILNSSSRGLMDNMLLTICVLTSDSVNFAVGLSDPLVEDKYKSLSKMYVEAESLLNSRPAFMLLYSGVYDHSAVGEFVISALDQFSDKVPIFGSMPADFSTELKSPRIIHNGAAYSDRAAIILVEGNITPTFSVTNLPLWRGVQQRAIITKSEGNVISEVNGVPVLSFLESMGLCWYGQISGIHSLPIILDRQDELGPQIRCILAQTPEGDILLTGKAPENSTISFGILDEDMVLRAVAQLGLSMQSLYSNIFYVYSCLIRNFAVGLNYKGEMEKFNSVADRSLPYIFSYSSGEFCPVRLPDGTMKNQYHNMSLISLAF
ncbi:MAG: hypothetical protein LBE27_03845 [Deltaproteobacteria bacterium]|jgi:hypothetical protein|nr:hypothetical protein [Deltaproteobacteria bacterium]